MRKLFLFSTLILGFIFLSRAQAKQMLLHPPSYIVGCVDAIYEGAVRNGLKPNEGFITFTVQMCRELLYKNTEKLKPQKSDKKRSTRKK